MSDLIIPRLAGPPPLDGHGNTGAWVDGPQIGPFVQHDGRPARQATHAVLLYDPEHLYAAFHCIDVDIWGSYENHDDPIYNEEVVEIFLDVEGRGQRYYEIEVSPLNVVLDGINTWPDGKLNWDPSWHCAGLDTKVAVYGAWDNDTLTDEWWTVTIAIPFAALDVATPTGGETWRINLYRIDHLRRESVSEYQAWRPTQDPGQPPDYNVPGRFGTVAFGG